MPFATRIKFQSVLACVSQPCQLAHRIRQRGDVMAIGHLACETVAFHLQIGWITGTFRQRIAMENQVSDAPASRDIRKKNQMEMSPIAPTGSVIYLGRYFLQPGSRLVDFGHADLAMQVRGLVRADSNPKVDRFLSANKVRRFPQGDRLHVFPAPSPGGPGGRKPVDTARPIHIHLGLPRIGTQMFITRQSVLERFCQGEGKIITVLSISLLDEFQFFPNTVGSRLAIGCFERSLFSGNVKDRYQ